MVSPRVGYERLAEGNLIEIGSYYRNCVEIAEALTRHCCFYLVFEMVSGGSEGERGELAPLRNC